MMSSQEPQASSFLRRFQIPLFFILAFALSWLVWGSAIAQHYGLLAFSIPDPLAYVGVSLAAFIVAGLVDGWVGIRDLLRRMIRWRVELRWYVIAIVLPIVLPFVTAGIYRLFGGSVPVGRFFSLEGTILYFIVAIPVFLLTEETAWRGFALPRLEVRYHALMASLILGLLWGVWHTPLFFMPGAMQTDLPFFAFLLLAMAQSVLFAWVYNNTGGSVLVMALLHATTDATLAYSGVGVSDVRAFWLLTTVTWAAAVIVVLVAGPAHLSRTNRVDQLPIAPPGQVVQERTRSAAPRP